MPNGEFGTRGGVFVLFWPVAPVFRPLDWSPARNTRALCPGFVPLLCPVPVQLWWDASTLKQLFQRWHEDGGGAGVMFVVHNALCEEMAQGRER